MKIVIEGDILDYIDEDELKDNIRYQIKSEISNILKDDKNIKEIIIKEVVNEVKDIQFSESIKQALKDKFEQIVIEDYLNEENSWNVKYDTNLSKRVNELYEESRSILDPILYKAIYNAIQNYKPENYEISRLGVDLISKDENAINKLKEIFIDRLDEIIEKI